MQRPFVSIYHCGCFCPHIVLPESRILHDRYESVGCLNRCFCRWEAGKLDLEMRSDDPSLPSCPVSIFSFWILEETFYLNSIEVCPMPSWLSQFCGSGTWTCHVNSCWFISADINVIQQVSYKKNLAG